MVQHGVPLPRPAKVLLVDDAGTTLGVALPLAPAARGLHNEWRCVNGCVALMTRHDDNNRTRHRRSRPDQRGRLARGRHQERRALRACCWGHIEEHDRTIAHR